MSGFCKHCGKELEGDEPYCPECGMPTGSAASGPAYSSSPKKNDVKIAVAVIAVVAVLCVIGIALLPTLIDVNNDKYTVTVTVTDFRIDVADAIHQYNGPMTRGEVSLSFACKCGSTNLNKTLVLDKDYRINTNGTPVLENKFTIEVTGDLKDLSFTTFMNYTVNRPGIGDITDYIDIYEVTPAPSGVKYIGSTGIVFDMSDVKGGSVTLKGDSDPLGTVNLSITAVKK